MFVQYKYYIDFFFNITYFVRLLECEDLEK